MPEAHSFRENSAAPSAPNAARHEPIHENPDRLSHELKRGHDKWRIVELKERIKNFKKLEKDGLLIETYKEKLRRGQIPPAYDFRGSAQHTIPDSDIARAWMNSEIAAAEEIINHLERAGATETAVEADPVSETNALPPPTATDIKPPNQKAVIFDASEMVRRMAWTQAEEKLNYAKNAWRTDRAPDTSAPATTKVGRFFKGLGGVAKNIGHTFKDAITHPKEFVQSIFVRSSEKQVLQKFYEETLAQMQTDKNLYAEIEAAYVSKSKGKAVGAEQIGKHQEAIDSMLEQFVKEVAEAEEQGEVVNDPDVNVEVGNLFYEYATGAFVDRAVFDAAVTARVVPILKAKGNRFHGAGAVVDPTKTGLMFGSNLFELAKTYKGYIEGKISELEREHGTENREIIKNHVKGLMALDIQLGLKERDIRETKPRDVKKWSTKIVDRLQSVPVLGKVLALPVTWAAPAAAVAVMVGRSTASRLLKTLANAPVVGGLLGATMGAMRRGRDLEYDRGLELRRQALGQEAGGARAAEVRRHNYSMLNLVQVSGRLDNILSKTPAEITPDDRAYVADVYARLVVEKNSHIDQFSGEAQEGQRLGLRVKSMTDMKERLKRLGETNPALALASLTTEISARATVLTDAAAANDKDYAHFRRIEMAKAAAFGAVSGMAAGVLTEAAIGAWHGHYHDTSMGRLQDWMTGGRVEQGSLMHTVLIPGSSVSMKLPVNQEIVPHGNGTFDIVYKDDPLGVNTLHNLQVDSSGTELSQASANILRDHGATIAGGSGAMNLFSGRTDVVHLSQFPGVDLQVPEGCEYLPSPSGTGFDLVDTMHGRVLFQNLNFVPGGAAFDAASLAKFDQLGWGVHTASGGPGATISNHNDIREFLKKTYGGGVDDPLKRDWHGNIDPRVGQVTSSHNPYYNGKLTGGVHENYPYEFRASADDAAASVESARAGLLDHAIHEGDVVKGHLIEGKELRVWLEEKNDEYVLDFKGLREMLKHGAKNWDGSLDHKYAQIKNLLGSGNLADATKNFRFRFYVDRNDFHRGDAWGLQMGPDAKIHLPKGSRLADIIVDHSGSHPTLKVTGETALNTGRGSARIFATKIGHDVGPLHIDGETIGVVPPSAADPMIIAMPHQPNMFIPLPFVPRWPMERGKWRNRVPPIGPYYHSYYDGGGDAGWRDSARYRNYLSARLKEDPHATLNEEEELKDYFKRMDPKHHEVVDELSEKIPSMKRECRVSVCIPAYKEGQRIYDGLKSYVNQKKKDGTTLDPKTFEILIFDNHPESVPKDKTENEVLRFKKDFPEINVHYLHATFPEKQPIGLYRKIVSDVAARRLVDQKNKFGSLPDHILISQDADFSGMSEKYFDSIITAFDKDRKMDAFAGLVDYPKEAYEKMPLLFASKRLWMYYDIIQQTRVHKKSPGLTGPNSGFRASMYAAVGGYNTECKLAEDLEIGNFIKDSRQRDPGYVRFLANARVYVDPRRGMATMMAGKPVIRQYDNWVGDEAIRDKTWQQMADEDISWAQFDKKRFLEEAETILSIYSKWDSLASRQDIMRRAMHCMGVEIAFDGEKIRIIDTSRLEKGAEELKDRKKSTMQVKSRQKINRKSP